MKDAVGNLRIIRKQNNVIKNSIVLQTIATTFIALIIVAIILFSTCSTITNDIGNQSRKLLTAIDQQIDYDYYEWYIELNRDIMVRVTHPNGGVSNLLFKKKTLAILLEYDQNTPNTVKVAFQICGRTNEVIKAIIPAEVIGRISRNPRRSTRKRSRRAGCFMHYLAMRPGINHYQASDVTFVDGALVSAAIAGAAAGIVVEIGTAFVAELVTEMVVEAAAGVVMEVAAGAAAEIAGGIAVEAGGAVAAGCVEAACASICVVM